MGIVVACSLSQMIESGQSSVVLVAKTSRDMKSPQGKDVGTPERRGSTSLRIERLR